MFLQDGWLHMAVQYTVLHQYSITFTLCHSLHPCAIQDLWNVNKICSVLFLGGELGSNEKNILNIQLRNTIYTNYT